LTVGTDQNLNSLAAAQFRTKIGWPWQTTFEPVFSAFKTEMNELVGPSRFELLRETFDLMGRSHPNFPELITSTKSDKPRVFSISPQLTERLHFFVEDSNPSEPLFVTGKGKRLNPDNFVRRILKPILKAFGLQGAHKPSDTVWPRG
jgi:hypothetical protein